MSTYQTFQRIAVAKEIESPENPGGLEKRVALIPEDVSKLRQTGRNIYVEYGAGEGVGFSDEEYLAVGALLESADDIYRNKDLIIKFKGPAMASVEQMQAGCTLFCMAHFHSFPKRAALLEKCRINVIAMEDVLTSPKINEDWEILSRTAMAAALEPFLQSGAITDLAVRIIGWTPELAASVRRAGNRNPQSLHILPMDLQQNQITSKGENTLYFYDSKLFSDPGNILPVLRKSGTHLFDRADFAEQQGKAAISHYRETHPPLKFGLRRIQCLHETGRAGARYGLKLLKENKPALNLAKAKALVLGYGNIATGAMHELYAQGVKCIEVLGRRHTAANEITSHLQGVDLIVNGAEQAKELRGKNFLITKQHVKENLTDGSVIIDLVGGSAANRSPVENVINCTFLTDPHFVEHGVTIASLWGWPMMGMMRETAIRYSGQICDVLIGREQLALGLGKMAPGIAIALVCGPFSKR